MARLTDSEQSLLKKLQAKLDAPDAGPIARAINVTINLADPKQVAQAIKMGLLEPFEDEPADADELEQVDEAPKRRGYFND